MIAVDEINIAMARRTEQDRGAGGVAGGGMGSGIVFSEIGFYLDDAGRQTGLSVAHQNLTEKFASHATRIAREERAIERADEPERSGRKHEAEVRMPKLVHKNHNTEDDGSVSLFPPVTKNVDP